MAAVSVFLSFVPCQMLKRMGLGSREINSVALQRLSSRQCVSRLPILVF